MSDPLIYSEVLTVSAYSSNFEATGYEASQLGAYGRALKAMKSNPRLR